MQKITLGTRTRASKMRDERTNQSAMKTCIAATFVKKRHVNLQFIMLVEFLAPNSLHKLESLNEGADQNPLRDLEIRVPMILRRKSVGCRIENFLNVLFNHILIQL
jgi:hypothetical protein